MVFDFINRGWGNIFLKVLCFQCRYIKAAIISSIKVNDLLTFSEYFHSSEIRLLIPDWISCVRSINCTVCVHCNGNSTNWSIFKKFLLNELVLCVKNDKALCSSLLIVDLQEYRQECPFLAWTNYTCEQCNKCRASNQQFQD